MSPAPPPSSSPVYSERLYVPIGWWIGTLVLTAILGLELAPLIPWPILVTTLIPVALGALLLLSMSLTRIEVSGGVVRIARWQLACAEVASVEELDQRNTRRYAGVAGDPAAIMMIRPWIRTSVRIICVTDRPPFALISSRHPEKLSAAIVACASAAAEEDELTG